MEKSVGGGWFIKIAFSSGLKLLINTKYKVATFSARYDKMWNTHYCSFELLRKKKYKNVAFRIVYSYNIYESYWRLYDVFEEIVIEEDQE